MNYYGDIPKSHNFGPECRLAPVAQPFPPSELDEIPPINAQYFYSSPIPIDDPLSASAITATTTDSKASKANLQPFSRGDNNALERAWLGLASAQHCRNHAQARRSRSPSPSLARANADKLTAIVHDLAVKHAEKHAREGPSRETTHPVIDPVDPVSVPGTTVTLCCRDLLPDAGIALRTSFCAVARRHQKGLDREKVAQDVMAEMATLRTNSEASVTTTENKFSGRSFDYPGSLPSSKREPADASVSQKLTARARSQSNVRSVSLPASEGDMPPVARSPLPDHGISDSPGPPLPQSEKEQHHNSVDIPVGVSRLHKVSLPALQMKPIYWSPVNDIATVLRATWFYRDDMRPLDPAVANQLEAGYRELKPHTETWADELRSAIEVGPLGEEKVSHPLWPKEPKSSARGRTEDIEPPISSNPFCAARCFRGEAAAEGSLLPSSNEDNTASAPTQKKFEQYHVIYKDSTTAFLLKPSLKPSAYYGRRPVAKIAKGFTVGIPVVRGFDYEVWMRKHQKKQTQQQYSQRYELSGGNDSQRPVEGVCAACEAEKERGQVSDLVLVIHGIGQKLAERVQTYHFTHAINAFRRAINVELRNEAVRAMLRDGQNGIMVLPVNWRENLSFEEGGPTKEEDKDTYNPQGFGLRDIEPKTIPAVRSMISDVMFDIPFYMSHHKPKMVAAVVGEANRVYRLWCQNNPGFSKRGRVHVIGHSLGSVMSLEVLSRQPTVVPPLQLEKPMQLEHFEFDTKNLFFLGSPAAFFLLLERGALMPRRGRKKPGADPADTVSAGVVGSAGSFGCIAVDNIYNVLAREDAVAYLLNGTVDPTYAASLKTAYVPSTTTSFLQSMGNAVMSIVPGVSSSNASGNPGIARPPAVRLPSQLELEVHDFTREEIAEKKAYLLNDNGQIDYFLRSGGGPLELQYLNMLSAHSSYWVNHDLIRMLCMEIGRKPGKANTLPAMRATKATKRIVPSTG
ncbi:hypothetical protein DL766_008803 [Monosporascus sp. MC13-8B]|uniref:DDHD domain-containing protein n=1 Tax=Monosporascus cannonballus TaxID=155416 RepID=A0ABY0HBF4_9PEZI|nr:hypothetical protein DL762_004687 [Monosporascus cannonballus]RYO98738.1 hypothetical protein DL763_001999 [Monosporascus cannonballus]RYP17849.1 hypothetical protein DL766_008803 [Monosporascus sp. MC13-8B]